MRRWLGVMVVAALAATAAPSWGDEETRPSRRESDSPTYESPLLTLLLLPVNILVKMASTLGPAKGARPDAKSEETGERPPR